MAAASLTAQNRIIVLLIAAAVDLIIGDPEWLPHPVRWIGALVSLSEKALRRLFAVPAVGVDEEGAGHGGGSEEGTGRGGSAEKADMGFRVRERIAGAFMVLFVIAVSTGCTLLLLRLCSLADPWRRGAVSPLRTLAEGILCGRLLALKSLGEAAFSVRDPLREKDIEGARRAVSMIVGRDTERLDEEGIAKAAVETVAENTSDGVTAPLFYMFLFGGAGGVFYKAVNTMDSRTGYRNDRYRYFGTAAARLDDIMNYIPSRLTAIFMVAACAVPFMPADRGRAGSGNAGSGNAGLGDTGSGDVGSGDAGSRDAGSRDAGFLNTGSGDTGSAETMTRIPDMRAAYRIWRRDRRKSPSPNSAQTESACAGALHLRLLGDTWYFGELHRKVEIGDGDHPAGPEDITRAVCLMYRTSFLMFAVWTAVLLAFAAV